VQLNYFTNSEFYYDDPDKGIVVVAAKGERGLFDIAYQLETSLRKVSQGVRELDDLKCRVAALEAI
jgi:hypothetical protein